MNQVEALQLSPYEKLYGRRLSCDEVAEMKSNLTGFMVELIKADKENQAEAKRNDQSNRNPNSAN